MSLYIIAVGGTGAKFVEALTHVAAAGLLGENTIRVLFVDPDEANGHINRAIETIYIYQECYRLLGNGQNREATEECTWMQSPMELFSPNLWSPLGSNVNRTLSSLFNYDNYKIGNGMRNLFDALYTEAEKETSLDMGFRGRPAIGSAVMSRVDNLSQAPWPDFFEKIKKDSGNGRDARIFLCGSAFGGTGASGFPTLGRLISDRLEAKDMNCRSSVKLGGVLLLPYFDFTVPGDIQNSEELYANPNDFLLNTEAALRYYRDQARKTFDLIYLLGTPNPSSVEQFSLGKGEQCNPPHFIELYAALAVRHFLNLSPKGSKPESRGQAVVIKRKHSEKIGWDDLPEDVKSQLLQTTRFAAAWATDMDQTLRDAHKDFESSVRLIPWMTEFFYHPLARKKDLPRLDQKIASLSVITQWCENYLQWLKSLHLSPDNRSTGVNLFNCNAFLDDGNKDKFRPEPAKLWELVGKEDESDTIARLKSKYLSPGVLKTDPKSGLVGVARSLYVISRQEWR